MKRIALKVYQNHIEESSINDIYSAKLFINQISENDINNINKAISINKVYCTEMNFSLSLN